jgi:general secretion pathway protein G
MLGSFPRSTSVKINIKSIKWGLAIPCGWLVILVGSTVLLPSADSRRFEFRAVPMLALIIVWLLLTVVALGVYFYRAWKRLRTVPNEVAYATWLSFQTVCALAAAAALASSFVPSYVTSPRKAREFALQQNLHVMRTILNQYALDLRRRPQSLADLVEAGYIRRIPADPTTQRDDTWVLEWSDDPRMPGIVNIRSGSSSISSKGSAYHDW